MFPILSLRPSHGPKKFCLLADGIFYVLSKIVQLHLKRFFLIISLLWVSLNSFFDGIKNPILFIFFAFFPADVVAMKSRVELRN